MTEYEIELKGIPMAELWHKIVIFNDILDEALKEQKEMIRKIDEMDIETVKSWLKHPNLSSQGHIEHYLRIRCFQLGLSTKEINDLMEKNIDRKYPCLESQHILEGNTNVNIS